jgi:hypothetical protein
MHKGNDFSHGILLLLGLLETFNGSMIPQQKDRVLNKMDS